MTKPTFTLLAALLAACAIFTTASTATAARSLLRADPAADTAAKAAQTLTIPEKFPENA